MLANKTRDNQFIYLDPSTPDVMPAGVSRSYRFSIGPDVARYRVSAAWYRQCGVIETDQPGPAAELASRSAALIREHTAKEGFDAGRVWRYLRRDLRTGKPEEDGAEWEGNLAQAMFTLAYWRGRAVCPPGKASASAAACSRPLRYWSGPAATNAGPKIFCRGSAAGPS